MHLLELIKKREEENPSLEDFLQYYENLSGDELYVNIVDLNAVRILTVHKSKGLQFPVVIVPFLGLEVKVAVRGEENPQSYVVEEDNEGLRLLKLKDQYYKFSENLYNIYRRHYISAMFAELNSIYVSLTRAKDELYCFIPKKVGTSFNLARVLIPPEIHSPEVRIKKREQKTEKPAVKKLETGNYCDWIDYLKEEFLDEGSLKQRHERLKGEAVHFILSKIKDAADVESDNLDSIIKEAENEFPGIVNKPEYKKRIIEIVSNENLKEIFDTKGQEFINELEVLDSKGILKRIDRVIIKDNLIKIIDYKTGQRMDEHKVQVLMYKKIISEIYPRKTIEAWLVYLDDCSILKV